MPDLETLFRTEKTDPDLRVGFVRGDIRYLRSFEDPEEDNEFVLVSAPSIIGARVPALRFRW